VVEATLQPQVLSSAKALKDQVSSVKEALHQAMGGAQPADLGAVAAGLSGSPAKVDLAALAERVRPGFGQGLVDADRLRDVAQAGHRIESLVERLRSGPQGLGRSRYGVVVAQSAALRWAAAFPDNPFTVPVQIVPGAHVAQVARGLALAWCDRAVQVARLVRWAKALVDSPREAADVAARPLHWADLDAAERRLCPPVLLVGEAAALEGEALGELAALLAADLPIRIVILDNLDPAADCARELELLSMASDRAFLVQTSPSHPEHMVPAVQAALRHHGPAVIRMPTLRPDAHGFGRDAALAMSGRAVDRRVFPLLRYDPHQAGVFGTRLSLEGNREPAATWPHDDAGAVLDVIGWAAPQERSPPSSRPTARAWPPSPTATWRPSPTRGPTPGAPCRSWPAS